MVMNRVDSTVKMKVVILKKSLDIPEESPIKIFVNGKLAGKIKNSLRFNIECSDNEESIELYAQWQWCRSRKYVIPVKDGMVLEILPNKFVDRRYALIATAVAVITMPLGILLDFRFLLFLAVLLVFPMYYITFGKNRYLQIREL
jgi:hypothetical protein